MDNSYNFSTLYKLPRITKEKIMTNCINTSNGINDVSLKFCSCCLKKFIPHPSDIKSDRIYLFLPTIDSFLRSHFIYVEMPMSVVKKAYATTDKISFNIGEVANILHLEIGVSPSEKRAKEIIEFYSSQPSSKWQTFYC